ncbi:hydantoinase B/oxoprolinase family protein [Kordiimonas pumila]|uniref:Hydantoinase B/oxoprolinase family protein n=1 Tax=Kordiimonas pumila TaxID=2161677 RepID=A0ABV7D4P0_9PROT|nr:hydantoinase B/oxoprolinase family protein [Kordiimonas pumila]
MTRQTTAKAGIMDPITTEIIQSSLTAITDEMFATMRKTAMSSIIYEVLDFGVAMMDAAGNLASSGSGIPGFIGMLEPGVRSVIKKFDPATHVFPGDIFMTNIPHHGGVSHLNDVVLVLPVFVEGQLIAWLANKAHWVDIGGSFPGSISADAVDVYQEGLQLPCIKVIESGKTNQSVLDILAMNSRMPDITIGDFWAGIASMRAGERRLLSLVEKYGFNAVMFAITDYIATGEAMSLKALKALPKGTFKAADITDGGTPICVSISISDTEFLVDLRGNPPQSKDAFNASFDATFVGVQMIYKSIAGSQSVANAGTFRPLKLLVDDDSMFAAQYPAAMSVYYETSIMLFDLMWKALAPILPEFLPAGHYASICGTFMGGPHPETGKNHSIVEPQIGGWGACYDRDGLNALYTGYHGDTFNVPVEIAEQRNGIMIDKLSLNEEPGGEGEFIGGKGINLHYRILHDDWWITMAYVRSKNGPWGLNGGLEGSTNYVSILRKDGSEQQYSSCTAIPLKKDDVVKVATANGGGYGAPKDRPVAKVLEDIKNGYITKERAFEIYGVKNELQ